MSRRMLRTPTPGLALSRAAALAALCTLPQLPLPCGAEPLRGASRAAGQLRVTLVVLPVFNVLEVTRVKDGYEYRLWTNSKSLVIGGQEHRFSHAGEVRLRVDGRESEVDTRLNLDRSLGLGWRSVSSHPDGHGRAPALRNAPAAGNQPDIHTVTVAY
ncbi:hypothetical protein QTI33_13810 [Variovorax sp. J22P271]|uniref:hypothetical protein n=1 Tax=Variovorax davisae TaxID=3053515 RepID=UPI0025787967|nr:hypothetical protein [Variovorax sp. J22P271]MDM0033204.1 hypothetical protein [Variovorax sp. J22P271]